MPRLVAVEAPPDPGDDVEETLDAVPRTVVSPAPRASSAAPSLPPRCPLAAPPVQPPRCLGDGSRPAERAHPQAPSRAPSRCGLARSLGRRRPRDANGRSSAPSAWRTSHPRPRETDARFSRRRDALVHHLPVTPAPRLAAQRAPRRRRQRRSDARRRAERDNTPSSNRPPPHAPAPVSADGRRDTPPRETPDPTDDGENTPVPNDHAGQQAGRPTRRAPSRGQARRRCRPSPLPSPSPTPTHAARRSPELDDLPSAIDADETDPARSRIDDDSKPEGVRRAVDARPQSKGEGRPR